MLFLQLFFIRANRYQNKQSRYRVKSFSFFFRADVPRHETHRQFMYNLYSHQRQTTTGPNTVLLFVISSAKYFVYQKFSFDCRLSLGNKQELMLLGQCQFKIAKKYSILQHQQIQKDIFRIYETNLMLKQRTYINKQVPNCFQRRSL